MAELGLELAEVRAGLKRPPRSERPVLARCTPGLPPRLNFTKEDMLTTQPTNEARVAIEPGFAWDAQDAYLFDIDGTLLRSRDRVHVLTPSPPACSASPDLKSRWPASCCTAAPIRRSCARPAVRRAFLPRFSRRASRPSLKPCANTVAERRHELDLVRMPGVEQTLDHLARRGRAAGRGHRQPGDDRLDQGGAGRACASGSASADSATTFPFARS
jgi:hypothetical protein